MWEQLKSFIRGNWRKLLFGLSITTIIAIIGLFITYKQYLIAKQDLEISEKQYNDSKRAEIHLDYRTTGMENKPILYISNVGQKRADSIWISQKVYLCDEIGKVFECDLPSYSYISFRGSSRKMFDLDPGQDTSIAVSPKCFGFFKRELMKKFAGHLVVQWRIDFNQAESPIRETRISHYILNDLDNPYPPDKITGGRGFVESIDEYQKYGTPKLLEYVHEFKSYFLNPPHEFYYDENGDLQFCYPDLDLPKGTEMLINIPMDEMYISHGGKGYLAFLWDCADEPANGKGVINTGSPPY